MISPAYRAQVDLLLRILPHVAKENTFALKGGTAINLFVRAMPRLSVDIDLTYLPFEDRVTAMTGISAALRRTKERIEASIPNCKVALIPQSDGQEAKLICKLTGSQIKIEVNTTIRGHLFPTRIMDIAEEVETEFGHFASMNVVSHSELYGGKICAALDRQHPRDLFDVHHLLLNEGFTDDIRFGLIASLVSHSRPLHEIIRPRFLDQKDVFERQFAGMTFTSFTYEDYEIAREQLLQKIQAGWTDVDREFLLSFTRGQPDWSLLRLEKLPIMPAVQWKLANVRKLILQNPRKLEEQLRLLEDGLR